MAFLRHNSSMTKTSLLMLLVLVPCTLFLSGCADDPADHVNCYENRSANVGPSPPNLGTLEGEGNAEFHWSPNGEQIIFRIFNGDIFIVNVPENFNGAPIEPQVLTNTPGFDLSWSPTGREIAFASRINTISLIKLDVSSREEVYLTSNEWDANPIWSPDGQKIGFHRKDRLYLMDLNTEHITQLTRNSAGNFTGAPDSNKIAYISYEEPDNLFTINLPDMDKMQLTNTTNCEEDPSWFPDGQKLAFIASYEGNLDIFLINSDGTNLENITNSNEDEMQFSLSPDGERIAYTLLTSRGYEQYQMSLHIKNVNGGNSITVSPNIRGDISLPQWSPDGSRLAFLVFENSRWRIELVDANGNRLGQLTEIPTKGR